MMDQHTLKSERLYVRELTSIDILDDYLSWLADPEVYQMLEVRFSRPYDLQALRHYVSDMQVDPNSLLMGIFQQADDRHVGNIKLGPIDKHHNRADLGFLIGDKSVWGRGYASEAIDLVSRFALNELKLSKVTAGCYESNYGSKRALEKAGFEVEGVLKSHWVLGSRRVDGLVFGRIGQHNE